MTNPTDTRLDAFQAIKQYGFPFTLTVFVGLTIWAFWDTYWFREPRDYFFIEHIHALPTMLWCLLITAQTYLVKKEHFHAHRVLGRSAYVLGPLLVITTATIAWGSLTYSTITAGSMYIFSARVFLLSTFTLFFTLALINRKTPRLHAMWMTASAMILMDPILNRITDNFIDLSYTTGVHQFISFATMDLILGLLWYLDWRNRASAAFAIPLFICIVGQSLMLIGWDWQPWEDLVRQIPKAPFN